MWRRVKRLPIWGRAVRLSVLVVVLVIPLIPPSLPKLIRIGTGPRRGEYHAFGLRLAARLGEQGFLIELVPSEGSGQKVARQRGEAPVLDVAFVQGGVVPLVDMDGIEGVARLFYEPPAQPSATRDGR